MAIQTSNALSTAKLLSVTNSLILANQRIVGGIDPPVNAFGFLLEDSSGVILLESGDILLLENQV